MMRFKNISKSKLRVSKKWLLIVFVLLLNLTSKAQQLPNYTQYLYNMQVINPAFVGARAELSITALTKQQWVGVDGAPQTNTFAINTRMNNGLGLGVTFVNDKIGLSKTNTFNLDASVTLITSQYSRLSLGLKAGYTFFNNNYATAITPDNDVYASNSGNFYNVGFGALYQNQQFFVGLSMPAFLETPQFYIQENYKQVRVSKNPSFFLSAGYVMELTDEWLFKPTTMLRYTANAPISVDVNTNFLYDEVLELGLSYRHQSSLNGLFAIILNKKVRIGYAYEHKLTEIGNDFNSHEIIFHIDLDYNRNSRWITPNKCYF